MRNKVWIAALALLGAALVGMHLHLPYSVQTWRMDTPAAAMRAGERMPANLPQGSVQVNRATVQELDQLSGVGPVLAQQIITERETNGCFSYPEDLINVNGIGIKTLERMRDELVLP